MRCNELWETKYLTLGGYQLCMLKGLTAYNTRMKLLSVFLKNMMVYLLVFFNWQDLSKLYIDYGIIYLLQQWFEIQFLYKRNLSNKAPARIGGSNNCIIKIRRITLASLSTTFVLINKRTYIRKAMYLKLIILCTIQRKYFISATEDIMVAFSAASSYG